MPLKVFCFIFLVLASSISVGQHLPSSIPLHSSYDVEDGLQSNFVIFLFNDSRGLLWVGNEQGLCVFNGRHFETIDFSQVHDPFVSLIGEDENGTIWIATLGGGLYHVADKKAIPHPQRDRIEQIIENIRTPNKLAFAAGGRILLGSARFILEVTTDSVKELMSAYDHERPHFRTMGNDLFGVTATFNEDDRTAEIEFQEVSYNYLDTGENIKLNRYFYSNSPQSFAIANGLRLGLYCKGKLQQIRLDAPISNSVCFENDSVVWVGTEGAGAYKIVNGRVVMNVFSSESVYTICKDFEGGLWMGTGTSGLMYIPYDEAHFVTDKGGKKLKARNIALHNDRLVALTNDFSIYADGKLSSPIMSAEDVLHANFEIFETPGISYFASNDPKGVSRITRIDWESGTSTSKRNPWTPRKMYIQGQDTINSKHGGLSVQFGKAPSRIAQFKVRKASQISPTSRSNDFWIVSVDGVFLLHLDTARQSADISGRYGSLTNTIFLFQFAKRTVVACRDGNYYELDTASKSFQRIEAAMTQRAECFQMVNDSQCVVGTETGLLLITTPSAGAVKFRQLSREVGLPNHLITDVEVSSTTIYCLAESEVFSLPRTILYQSFPKPGRLSFAKASVRNDAVKASKTPTLMTDESILAPLHAVSFKARRQYHLEFRLVPLQSEWSEVQSTDFSFFNLPANDYSLQVRDAHGHQAELTFQVESYFYEQTWFIVLVILVCASLLASPFYFLNRFNSARARLEFEKNDLRLKALTSQLKPHFVFNALSSIQAYILRQNVRASSDYLAKFAMHIRHALEHSNQDDISLASTISSFQNYLDLERMRLNNAFDYSVIVDPTINPTELQIPVMLIQPYIENAVLHGIASMDEGGKIEVRLMRTAPNAIRCEIEDNGKGLPGNRSGKVSTAGNGMGTRINRERMQLLSALNKHHYEVNIRSNTHGPGVTATVEITFDNETH